MRLILICTRIKGLEGRNISNLAPSETANILCKQSGLCEKNADVNRKNSLYFMRLHAPSAKNPSAPAVRD